MRRSAPREAMAALRSGIEALERLELTPALMRMEIELRVLQATAASVTLGPGLPVVGEALRRVLALSPQMPDTPYMLYALYTLWLHTFTRGEIDSAVQQAEDLSRFAKRHPGPGRQLCAVRAAGLTQFVRGEFNTAATLLAVGIGLYDPEIRPVFARLTVHDPVTDMRCYRSWSLLFRGRLAEARAESAQALAGARESGHFFTQAHALLTMAFIDLHCGHTARGIATLREMFALADEHGFPYFESAGRVFEGYYLGRDGDAEAGLALVRAGAKWNVETESFLYVPGFIACEAELLARLGRHEEARGRMAAALRQMELTKACWDEAEIRTIDGIVRRLHCDSDGAETALRKAIEAACSQGAALRRLRAATALADLLATQGRQDAAREALAPALAPFEAEADAPAVLQAREFLAHL
jgi:hypothetical protein